MEWAGQGVWERRLSLASGCAFEFKFVIVCDRNNNNNNKGADICGSGGMQVQWEPGPNRALVPTGDAELHALWGVSKYDDDDDHHPPSSH